MDGVYRYCFSNQMSSMTPKIVMFSMEVGDAPKDHVAGDGMTLLFSCIYTLEASLCVYELMRTYP